LDDLKSFADRYVGVEPGYLLNSLGPGSLRTQSEVENEVSTTALAATLFWQSFVASADFSLVLRRLGVLFPLPAATRLQIVAHANGLRFTLLLLVPGWLGPPTAITVEPSEATIRSGAAKWRNGVEIATSQERNPQIRDHNSRLLGFMTAQAATAVAKAGRFSLLVATLPPLEYLGCPTPFWNCVGMISGSHSRSTAGALVELSNGAVAITAARHAVGSKGNSVMLMGMSASVIADDVITDSALIDVPSGLFPVGRYGLLGPLTNSTPLTWQPVSFEGAKSGLVNTIVQSWDLPIPYLLPLTQLRVYTPLVTNKGDSGAGLADSAGKIIGFAFVRTGSTVPVGFSEWIWANSVYTTHSVQPYP